MAVSENSRKFAPVIPEKRKRRAQGKDEEREREGHRGEDEEREKRKRAYSCLKKQPYALYWELSLKRKLQAIGSMQCTNDYCTILKRIRNE